MFDIFISIPVLGVTDCLDVAQVALVDGWNHGNAGCSALIGEDIQEKCIMHRHKQSCILLVAKLPLSGLKAFYICVRLIATAVYIGGKRSW